MTAQAIEPDADRLADAAALALVQCRALADTAETARRQAADARDAAAAALYDVGWTVRRIGAELGVSHTRAHQMVKAHRERVWGGFGDTYRPGDSQADMLSEYRVARHAQDQRAEVATGGYATELNGFYGRPDTAQPDQVESPIVWAQWIAHRVAMGERR